MQRNLDWKNETDGRLYTANDLAKLGCNECEGCSECCRFVDDTIILDPWDIYHLEKKTELTFEQLLGAGHVGLRVVDGVILPHLAVLPEGGCTFLTLDGRCSIHDARPGFCRLFPLGRSYENGGFHYFLQTNECAKPNRTKIKIRNWLGIPDLSSYEAFVIEWHYFLKPFQEAALAGADEATLKQISMYILKTFFLTPYNTEHAFENQFQRRMSIARRTLSTDKK